MLSGSPDVTLAKHVGYMANMLQADGTHPALANVKVSCAVVQGAGGVARGGAPTAVQAPEAQVGQCRPSDAAGETRCIST